MKNTPHPGRIIRQECIEPLGMTITQGAKAPGVSRNALSELLNERRFICPEMATRLDRAFGGGADTGHRMQAACDMAQAMKNAGNINVVRVQPPTHAAGRRYGTSRTASEYSESQSQASSCACNRTLRGMSAIA
jgi:addiction module HigA family antidote